jgi:hypothetical protein
MVMVMVLKAVARKRRRVMPATVFSRTVVVVGGEEVC